MAGRTFLEPVSVLMPVCNEADIIEDVLEEWVRDVVRHLPEGSEIRLDDAASSDGTLEILERLRGKYPFISFRTGPRDGFAAAARRLYASARCPWVFFTDSDGQYVPEEFWKLAPHAAEYPFIHGAKVDRQDPLLRRAASAVFNLIARLMFAAREKDINSAFRLVRKDVVDQILPELRCMPSLLNAEMLLRARFKGFKIKDVPVDHRERKFGVSRGLPPAYFLEECVKAFNGLRELKKEYKKTQR